jgi:putative thioredoxin
MAMSESAWVSDVTEQNLEQLIAQSHQQLVLVDFWAGWCQPCQQLAPILERLVGSYQGKLLLARVNADSEQRLAAQFGVRSLPTLKLLSQGQLVAELTGLQTEAALRKWLQPYLDPGAAAAEQLDAVLEQARAALAEGRSQQVLPVLHQLLQERPEAHAVRALLVEWLLSQGAMDDARALLAEITDDVDLLKPFHARFALLEKVAGESKSNEHALADMAAAANKTDATPEDLYLYGMHAAASGQFREGLEVLLQLLRDHRDYRDGIARTALLDVFGCLPKGDPLTSEYRRRMFNYLH